MSQPLSQKNKQRIPIKGDEKRNYMAMPAQPQRTIPARQAVTLLLILVGVVCLPVGAGIAWGIGPALFTLGAVALILGIILEVL